MSVSIKDNFEILDVIKSIKYKSSMIDRIYKKINKKDILCYGEINSQGLLSYTEYNLSGNLNIELDEVNKFLGELVSCGVIKHYKMRDCTIYTSVNNLSVRSREEALSEYWNKSSSEFDIKLNLFDDIEDSIKHIKEFSDVKFCSMDFKLTSEDINEFSLVTILTNDDNLIVVTLNYSDNTKFIRNFTTLLSLFSCIYMWDSTQTEIILRKLFNPSFVDLLPIVDFGAIISKRINHKINISEAYKSLGYGSYSDSIRELEPFNWSLITYSDVIKLTNVITNVIVIREARENYDFVFPDICEKYYKDSKLNKTAKNNNIGKDCKRSDMGSSLPKDISMFKSLSIDSILDDIVKHTKTKIVDLNDLYNSILSDCRLLSLGEHSKVSSLIQLGSNALISTDDIMKISQSKDHFLQCVSPYKPVSKLLGRLKVMIMQKSMYENDRICLRAILEIISLIDIKTRTNCRAMLEKPLRHTFDEVIALEERYIKEDKLRNKRKSNEISISFNSDI